MAKIQIINDWSHINVSATVGAEAVNLRNDVMVVQALLKYALEPKPEFSRLKFPEPTGTINEATIRIIRKFQQYASRREAIKVMQDGRIDPARGEKVPGKNRRWTILTLNLNALEMALLSGDGANGGYINAICRKWQQVSRALGEPVGSLHLSLESSAPPVGSLGLPLE